MNQTPTISLAATLLAAATAVAVVLAPRLPITAQARLRPFDPALLESGDLIRYRTLARDDFRAEEPPPEAVNLHARLGAATCVFLATDPDMYLRSSSRGLDLEFGQMRTVVENLGFIAYLDRECSWWNPTPLGLPSDYILQHEQIHFALFEIAARRLSARAAEMAAELETVTRTPQEAVDAIQSRLDAELAAAMQEIIARSNDFDRETSEVHRQDRQSWWWTTVGIELERLRPRRP